MRLSPARRFLSGEGPGGLCPYRQGNVQRDGCGADSQRNLQYLQERQSLQRLPHPLPGHTVRPRPRRPGQFQQLCEYMAVGHTLGKQLCRGRLCRTLCRHRPVQLLSRQGGKSEGLPHRRHPDRAAGRPYRRDLFLQGPCVQRTDQTLLQGIRAGNRRQ